MRDVIKNCAMIEDCTCKFNAWCRYTSDNILFFLLGTFTIINGVSPLYGQTTISHEIVDTLIREMWESVADTRQDIIGYDVVKYKEIPFGTYRIWDYQFPVTVQKLPAHSEYALDRTYTARDGDVSRGTWYSPDEIGQLYRDNGVWYSRVGHGNTGMGLSTVETISIIKKYGLRWCMVTPRVVDIGDALVSFRPKSMQEYYRLAVDLFQEFKKEVEQYERQYDITIINHPETIWVIRHSGVVSYFLERLAESPDLFLTEFKAETGFDMPLMLSPVTPEEKARRSLLFRWIWSKLGLLAHQHVEAFYEVLQPAGIVVSNTHGEDVVDFEWYGKTYEFPGPSARPQFSDNELILLYWSGYIFKLWRDLTDRPLYASARINNGNVNARSIPAPNAVKLWHSQAIQSGTVGFYQYMDDHAYFPERGDRYDGFCFGNPDRSQLGKLRWQTALDISRRLMNVKAFDPPKSQTGIFLSFDTVNIQGWKRVFSLYVELCKAKVWNGFISDSEIFNASENLNDWKVVYIPVMDFGRREIVDALVKYVKDGGTLISCDPDIFSWDMEGNTLKHQRGHLFGITVTGDRKGSQNIQIGSGQQRIQIPAGAKSISVEDAEVIGRYADGSPAVTAKKIGGGKAIYFAAPVADIYTHSAGTSDPVLDGRGDFYKQMERDHSIPDMSWIWNITVDNVHQITGTAPVLLPPVNEEMILN